MPEGFFLVAKLRLSAKKKPSGTQGKVTPPKAKLPPLTGVESGEGGPRAPFSSSGWPDTLPDVQGIQQSVRGKELYFPAEWDLPNAHLLFIAWCSR